MKKSLVLLFLVLVFVMSSCTPQKVCIGIDTISKIEIQHGWRTMRIVHFESGRVLAFREIAYRELKPGDKVAIMEDNRGYAELKRVTEYN